MSFVDDINNLDPNNPGVWPLPIKAMLFAIVFAAIVYAGWHFDITVQRESLSGLGKERKKIKLTYWMLGKRKQLI